MIKAVDNLKGWHKTSLAILHDYVASGIALFAALALAFGDFNFVSSSFFNFWAILLLVSSCQWIVFYFAGLYKGIWRFSSAPDLIRVVRGASIAVMSSYLLLFLTTRLEHIPRSSLIIDWLLLIVFLGGGRFSYRLSRELFVVKKKASDTLNVLVIGAGNSGEQLLRSLQKSPNLKMRVVAFVDDNQSYVNKWVHRVPVAGTTEQIPEVCERYQIQKIIIAIPHIDTKNLRRIIKNCDGIKAPIKKLPKMSEYLLDEVDVTQLQNIELEDLIGRRAVVLELGQINQMLQGKKVLVTGAGGSIGSELCHQIAGFNPAQLIAVEISEFNLYQLEQSLKTRLTEKQWAGVIADVRSKKQMDKIFEAYSPEVVIHAAAYKHVPIMEKNPEQAISNNIAGTQVVAGLAVKHKAEKFVLVSTDKAVNPTNIMGATKRIAEMVCQHYQAQTESTKFVIVRFGNVIGSSGSVIPLFLKQIQEGGPVTVTHPEVNRFFMSIPEAAQLILQASVLGKGGEIFVLDMGEPVKIADLAKQLITLHGLTEGQDIEIVYTGLRPGEKLYEEVLFESESTLETAHPMIRVARAREVAENLPLKLESILLNDKITHEFGIKEKVQDLVPEYVPFKKQKSAERPATLLH